MNHRITERVHKSLDVCNRVDKIGKVKHQHKMKGQGPYLYTASLCPPFNSVCEQNPRSLRTHYEVKAIHFLNGHNEEDNTSTILYFPVEHCNSFTKL